MLNYDFYYVGYSIGALTLDQVQYGVTSGAITKDEYKTITGQDYPTT